MGDTEEAVAEAEAAAVEEEPYVELHAMAPGVEYVEASDTFPGGGFIYLTKCGKTINEEALGITDDADAVTCSACKGA